MQSIRTDAYSPGPPVVATLVRVSVRDGAAAREKGMHHMRMSHRIRYAAALAAVGLVTSAGTASAHHCYKDQWADAAYQHHLNGGTAWITLSDLGTMFLVPPELQAECGWVVDDVVADWMADKGMSQEPLIHSRATVGGGAFYHKGKAPGPFEYLGDEDFMMLEAEVMAGLELCAGS